MGKEKLILLVPDAFKEKNNQRQLFKLPEACIDLGLDSKHIITIVLLLYHLPAISNFSNKQINSSAKFLDSEKAFESKNFGHGPIRRQALKISA